MSTLILNKSVVVIIFLIFFVCFHKNIKQLNIFQQFYNIDNNEKFSLSNKSAY